MTEMFEVQKGVPLPVIDRSPKGRRKYPVETMAVGDMFFIPGKSGRSVSAYVSRITKDLPGKFSARRTCMNRHNNIVGDDKWYPCAMSAPGATEGTGVWRVE